MSVSAPSDYFLDRVRETSPCRSASLGQRARTKRPPRFRMRSLWTGLVPAPRGLWQVPTRRSCGGSGRLTTRLGKDRRPAELICPQSEQQRRHGQREGPPLGRRGISGLLPGPRWTTTTRLPWRGRRVLGRENPVPVVEMERRSARYVSKHNKRGERFSWRSMPMRGWPPAPLDPMKFPLTLGGHLRRAFNHVVSSPLPQKLAELVRRVKSDETDARKGAETSSRSDR
jgi:hypothetical protein